jgi:hypothetical protein
MSLEHVSQLLETRRGGVWHLDRPLDGKSLQKAAKSHGFAYFHIDGTNIGRKEQLLNHVALALHFPKSFGNNWDALEECLTDLEWVEADGYVIYYDHIDGLLAAHPDQFETFVEIVRDAVASWEEDGESMVVLLAGGHAPKGVQKLKAKAAD